MINAWKLRGPPVIGSLINFSSFSLLGLRLEKTIDHSLSFAFILVKTSIPLTLIDSNVQSINVSCEGYTDFTQVHLKDNMGRIHKKYIAPANVLFVLAQDSEGITVCKSSNAMYAPQSAL